MPAIASADVSCTGSDLEEQICGQLPCPIDHCPNGFEYSVGYVWLFSFVIIICHFT